VREGKVSIARAATEYGLVVNRGSFDVDAPGTKRLRRVAAGVA
jgi:hypothetical protein